MIKSGLFPDYFPEDQKEAALKRIEEKKELNVMDINLHYLYEPFRFCIFPVHSPSSHDICTHQETLLKGEEKMEYVLQCKNLMCLNCCNYVLYEFKNIVDNSIVSIPFKLNDDQGFSKVKYLSKQMNMVNRCRDLCQKEYPFIMPLPPLDLERLDVLGIKKEFPAYSCLDLKTYGRKDLQSGLYFVDRNQFARDPKKSYCDMKEDNGGWTLFFVYRHHPYEKTEINLQKKNIPVDQFNGKSHINLQSLGYKQREIKDLRFFCLTSHKNEQKQQYYVHFKTSNEEVIKTAFDGDQHNLQSKSFAQDIGQLSSPQKMEELKIELKIKQSDSFIVSSISKKSQTVNQNNVIGGLWDSPFSNPDGRWTVKGPKDNVIVYECGDYIPDQLKNGADYDTLHQVWFRGGVMETQDLEDRQIRIQKILENTKEVEVII